MRNVWNLHGGAILLLIGKIQENLDPRLRSVDTRFPRWKRPKEWRFCRGDQVAAFIFCLIRGKLGGFVTGNFPPDGFQKVFLKFLSRSLSLNGAPRCGVYLKQGRDLLALGF